jgi:dipicolinic acid synthetase B subunit
MKFKLDGKKILFGVTGGIAAYKALELISMLKKSGAEVKVIMTKAACEFVTPLSFQTISQNMVATDMFEEPKAWEVRHISLAKWADIAVVAPASANMIGKLANGITDTSVTMAVKAHLRNQRPVLLAVATNDALSASARNIGQLMNLKNVYFVPFSQDNAISKPTSMIADFNKIPEALEAALEGKQLQPILN